MEKIIKKLVVISPCRDEAEYMRMTLNSMISQSRKPDLWVIVDDGSRDRSMEIAELYASKDDRIKTFYNQKNLGDYPNRNRAASLANGKYLKYVDSDDYIFPNWFDVMVSAMETYAEAGIGINKFIKNSKDPGPFYYTSEKAYGEHFFQRKLFNVSPLSVIMKREVFVSLGGFSELRFSGDVDMWMRMAAASGVVITEHPLAEWREHGNQEKKKGEGHYLLMGRKIEKKYLQNESCPLSLADTKSAMQMIMISHTLKVLEFLKNFNVTMALRLMKAYDLTVLDMMVAVFNRILLGKGFYLKIRRNQNKIISW